MPPLATTIQCTHSTTGVSLLPLPLAGRCAVWSGQAGGSGYGGRMELKAQEANQALLANNTLDQGTHMDFMFDWHVAKAGFNHTFIHNAFGSRSTMEEVIAKMGIEPIHSSNGSASMNMLYLMDDVVVNMRRAAPYSALTITVASSSPAKAKEYAKKLGELFPPEPESDEKERTVNMRFWFNGANGPTNWDKKIVVPEWDDISMNYPKQEDIKELLEVEKPHGTGKLILWHGPPGVGKTYAIRALAWEWRDWCKTQYISDPEAFFTDPSYMMHVLMQENGRFEAFPDSKENWQLLICEDVGELMAKDAKMQAGQALSRVLNLTEGLIGQGMNTLLLFTTNEKITDLHPAVARAGRCLNDIEFRSFSMIEANEWLKAHAVEGQVNGNKTLGELYNMANHTMVGHRADKKMGFRR